jgi:hypothetical protein
MHEFLTLIVEEAVGRSVTGSQPRLVCAGAAPHLQAFVG